MTDNSVLVTDTSKRDLEILTWNIESVKKNIFLLKDTLENEDISLAFLSEPQIFQADIINLIGYVNGDFCYFLNSQDLYDPELPLVSSHAIGGTLCLWRKSLDPFITVYKTTSPSFTPIVLSLPDHGVSIHVGLYLPTHGKDAEFVSDLAELGICLDELADKYPRALFYIRGDSNVNEKNKKRVALFQNFMNTFCLSSVKLYHRTYHHFVGEGCFDSNVDIILYSSSLSEPENVSRIMCKLENPLILSHHDIIISRCSLPLVPQPPVEQEDLVAAPRIDLPRYKVFWSDEGMIDYEQLLSPHLKEIRKRWLSPNSASSMSILIKMTNSLMSLAATATNKFKSLSTPSSHKSKKTPLDIQKAKRRLVRLHRREKNSDIYNSAKQNYRRAVRRSRVQASIMRDQKLFKILDKDPRKAFNFIKSSRSTSPQQIESLSVGDKVYCGARVPDGFYDSMSSIKTCQYDRNNVDPQFAEHLANHDHILALCENKRNIPEIDIASSTSLLKRMKKSVNDIFSVSSLHYLNAGDEGLVHFNLILNAIISNVNNAKLEDMNLVLGLILWKGHKKDKNSDRSYRTISTCPLTAKATDMYIRDLYSKQWNTCQAPTQYQGEGSSHELAALLLTEVIQHSLHVTQRPVFLLSLDAQSAFDRCHRQILSTELYKAGINGTALSYIDNRLSSRSTVYHWEGNMMGPAKDDTGFEQGGVSSSDFYKLYNNEQLISTQRSGLGIDIKSSIISSIGQADDVVHVANTVDDLHLLATLTEQYCNKYKVTLVPSKTKLLVYANENHNFKVELSKICNPIKIGNVPVEFCPEAEHVGIIRNTSGNMPNILNRIASHKRSLGALLSAGLARGHKSNPAASLRVHQIYGTPVLFNGLAALYLSKSEVHLVDSHFLCTLQHLQRLHNKTPRAVVLFMAGSLPGEAILHLRQLSLFSMICRLSDDPLHAHGRYVLTRLPRSSKSWFHLIRDICLQYSLPHPLQLLQDPPTKQSFKTMAKTSVVKFWENLLRQESLDLPSLSFF